MPSYTKRKGRWLAQVRVKGFSKSKTFPTKTDAQAWAEDLEYQIRYGKPRSQSRASFGDVLKRYSEQVSPTKKGERWEVVRIRRLRGHRIAAYAISDITPLHIANFRDERLETVKPSSVNRELNLISSVFTTAIREWGLLSENPVTQVSRPTNPAPRHRRISPDEEKAILRELGTAGKSGEVAVAFRLALETAMRLGEILNLRESDIHDNHVVLPKTKNGSRREVPLSSKAKRLVRTFTVSPAVASALFRRAVTRAGIKDMTFHDTRHEATTRLARVLDLLDLARMTGHKDPRNLMIYYNPTSEEISKRLG